MKMCKKIFKNQQLLILLSVVFENVICESGSWDKWWAYEGISGI